MPFSFRYIILYSPFLVLDLRTTSLIEGIFEKILLGLCVINTVLLKKKAYIILID